jgi:hypothetical protein
MEEMEHAEDVDPDHGRGVREIEFRGVRWDADSRVGDGEIKRPSKRLLPFPNRSGDGIGIADVTRKGDGFRRERAHQFLEQLLAPRHQPELHTLRGKEPRHRRTDSAGGSSKDRARRQRHAGRVYRRGPPPIATQFISTRGASRPC